ncbi:hypothetical protein B5K06_33660 [Rhizobium grahamii]|uniref:Uncharacterized protein n=1 Tax=Rhizobium grahamii TaxID=1120045 RepID=A0A370KE13_9HYPH|nr:hypothetical protein B5K06_33660 [Rhizobium grahamii]
MDFTGFFKFYGYWRSQRFDFLPAEKTAADMLVISEGSLGQERARLRTLIEVERQSTASSF